MLRSFHFTGTSSGGHRALAGRPPQIERRRLSRAMLRVRAAAWPVASDRQAILTKDMPDEDFAFLKATWIALGRPDIDTVR